MARVAVVWFVVALALVVSVASLGVAMVALRRTARPGPGDEVPGDVLGLRQEVAALRAESGGALRHLAVVRYDAHGDMGGHLSWSLALLDDAGAGTVVTSIHGRSEARTYAKTVTGWTSEQLLSPEEKEAISAARP